jgi:membrane protease YdiL (CAAX protease family)
VAQSNATVSALVVALGGPPLFALASQRLVGDAPSLPLLIALQIGYCGIAAVVVWVVLRKERLPLASIGLHTPRWSTLIVAGLLWFAGLRLLPLVTGPLRDWGATGEPDQLRRLALLPLWFRIVLALTGGVVEETLYRGYAIERLTLVTGRRWLAATLAAVAFGLAHAPGWGIRYALLADLPFGVVATLVYLWRRDLIANILAHDFGLLLAVLDL